MGLLDGLIGNVLGSVLSGNQRQDSLGLSWAGLAAATRQRAEIYSCNWR